MENNLKKFICPYCKADLKEVGIINAQGGTNWYDCQIINDKGEIRQWKEREFEANNYCSDFFCGDCHEELDLEELGLKV